MTPTRVARYPPKLACRTQAEPIRLPRESISKYSFRDKGPSGSRPHRVTRCGYSKQAAPLLADPEKLRQRRTRML